MTVETAVDTEFGWTSSSRSHVGLVRQVNEDACLDLPARGLWAVADGMGGHALGDVASRMVVETLAGLPPPESLTQFITDAADSLQSVNRQLRTEAATREVQIIGSTVVVLLAHNRSCSCLWAGDSRIYLFRDGRLSLLTRDHSQVEELLQTGTITDADALVHPARNLITRAIGASDILELDEQTLEVMDGDMFLLCSDGLSNEVGEDDMRRALIPGNCRLASDVLVDMALEHGGRDNISVVVVRAEDLYSTEKTVLNPAL